MISKLKSLKHFIEGLFFPLECLSCGVHTTTPYRLCNDCKLYLSPLQGKSCQFSSTHQDQKITCFSLFPLTHPIRQLFVGLKYHEHPYEFLTLIAERLRDIKDNPQFTEFFPKNAILVPVPLHPIKLKERGYNQALKIAEILSRVTELPINESLVRRTRSNQKQASLSRLLRFKNCEELFTISEQIPISENTTIILVDDVITTGATLLSLQKEIQNKYPKNPCQAFGVVKAVLPINSRDFALEQQILG